MSKNLIIYHYLTLYLFRWNFFSLFFLVHRCFWFRASNAAWKCSEVPRSLERVGWCQVSDLFIKHVLYQVNGLFIVLHFNYQCYESVTDVLKMARYYTGWAESIFNTFISIIYKICRTNNQLFGMFGNFMYHIQFLIIVFFRVLIQFD